MLFFTHSGSPNSSTRWKAEAKDETFVLRGFVIADRGFAYGTTAGTASSSTVLVVVQYGTGTVQYVYGTVLIRYSTVLIRCGTNMVRYSYKLHYAKIMLIMLNYDYYANIMPIMLYASAM